MISYSTMCYRLQPAATVGPSGIGEASWCRLASACSRARRGASRREMPATRSEEDHVPHPIYRVFHAATFTGLRNAITAATYASLL